MSNHIFKSILIMWVVVKEMLMPGAVYEDGELGFRLRQFIDRCAVLLSRTPLKTDSMFDIGSMSKSFTAMAVLILQEQGRLALTDTLSTFLPELPDEVGRVTLRQLLLHQSGIKDYANDLPWRDGDDMPTTLERLRTEKLLFEPGTRTAYSNSGYFLLTRIVEKITQGPFECFVIETIFKRLNMESADFAPDRTIGPVPNGPLGFHFPQPEETREQFRGAVNRWRNWPLSRRSLQG